MVLSGTLPKRKVDQAARLQVGQSYSRSMAHFRFDGYRLDYTIHGDGARTTVLMPGLLLSQKMQIRLAGSLAQEGRRGTTFDPLGHGASERPPEMWRYSIPSFAQQAVALLDHLEL